jgi:hypothetical protein
LVVRNLQHCEIARYCYGCTDACHPQNNEKNNNPFTDGSIEGVFSIERKSLAGAGAITLAIDRDLNESSVVQEL